MPRDRLITYKKKTYLKQASSILSCSGFNFTLNCPILKNFSHFYRSLLSSKSKERIIINVQKDINLNEKWIFNRRFDESWRKLAKKTERQHRPRSAKIGQDRLRTITVNSAKIGEKDRVHDVRSLQRELSIKKVTS